MSSAIVTTFLVLTVVLVLLPSEVAAFGAGDIPDFSYLEGKAFRHGDIENTLLELVKAVGHSQGGGLLGFAQNVLSAATGGAKFSKDDVKHVYFGNWLRDYSQAMDIAGLSQLSGDTITLIVGVLGFLEFGFATDEYEVTQDRLGVYLPVEHIDNPRGYAEKEGDARTYNQKLRPPVDPRELEVDSRTGMKNYMATENRGWDTSTAFIRRSLRDCIQKGRNAGGRDGPELWESYRLLGQGLHTLEDFTAHSNWTEIALRKLGHNEVFCHVGDNVYVDSPNGRIPPIVTGTFGGADFFHSLLGETTDKISQSSVTDLSAKMAESNTASLEGLKNILGQLKALSGNDSDSQMNHAEEMKRKSEAYHFDPNQSLPPEVLKDLKEVLRFHDDILRDIVKKMEMIPGLTDLVDGLSNALNAFVYTIIAPYVTPILTQVTSAVGEGSSAVISSSDQWEVFNDPNSSDPTHSVLSKDHFGIILNEPAGKVAKVVVEHSVNLIVEAWSNNSNPDDVINRILEAFHHPYYNNGRSEIQNRMLAVVEKWLSDMGQSKAQETIQSLTKDAVREGKNKHQGESPDGPGSVGGYSGGYSSGRKTGGSYGGGSTQQSRSGYGGSSGGNEYGSKSHGKSEDTSYGSQQSGYGRSDNKSYGNTQSGYGRSEDTYGSQQGSYGRSDSKSSNTQTGYGRSDDTSGGNRGGYGKSDNTSYGNTQGDYGRSGDTYGSTRGGYGNTQGDYGRSGDTSESTRGSYGNTQGDYGRSGDTSGSTRGGYGRSDDNSYSQSETTYGSSTTRHGGSDDNSGSYGRQEERSSGYGGSGGGYGSKRGDDNSYGTSNQRSGYQPSYQSSETTYSSGNTYSSSDTYPSGGGHGGSRQTEAGSYTSAGYGGGDSSYGSSGRGGYGSGGGGDKRHDDDDRHGKRHDEERRHKKHHDDDDETYGAGRLKLSDDDDDDKKARRGYGGGGYGGSRGYGSKRSGSDD